MVSDEGVGRDQRGYIGEYQDTTGLSYLNARYYDSVRGQLLSEDPVFWTAKQNLQNPQSLNSYSYANDNPVNLKDPSGKSLAGTLASIQSQINSIQVQIDGLRQQVSNVASSATLAIGNRAQSAYQNNSTARFLLDHPYVPAVIGSLPIAGYGAYAVAAAYGGTAIAAETIGTGSAACERYCPAGESTSVASGITETAQKIAEHAVARGHFPGETLQGATQIIEDTMVNPETVRLLEKSRVGFFNSATGMNVVFNPNVPYLGTAFNTLMRPEGIAHWFFNELH